MITATTITATTITVMRPHQFVITVTMRIPRTHAPPMDTGDQISSLTVYSSAPARGSPVGTDKDITAAVVMADTAAAVAVTTAVAGDTAVAVILQEDVADTPAEVVVTAAVVTSAAGPTACNLPFAIPQPPAECEKVQTMQCASKSARLVLLADPSAPETGREISRGERTWLR